MLEQADAGIYKNSALYVYIEYIPLWSYIKEETAERKEKVDVLPANAGLLSSRR